jgi:hypothetical protein
MTFLIEDAVHWICTYTKVENYIVYSVEGERGRNREERENIKRYRQNKYGEKSNFPSNSFASILLCRHYSC